MPDSNENTQSPNIVLNLDAWIQEAQSRAVEYQGLEEAQFFLTEARRYLAIKVFLSKVTDRIDSIKEDLLAYQASISNPSKLCGVTLSHVE